MSANMQHSDIDEVATGKKINTMNQSPYNLLLVHIYHI